MSKAYALVLEGLGTQDGQYRFSTGMPEGTLPFDSALLLNAVRGLEGLSWVDECNPILGSNNIGGFEVDLVADPMIISKFWTLNPQPIAYLAANAGAYDTTFVFDRDISALGYSAGSVLYIKREAVVLTSGAGTTWLVARGVLGTRAQAHFAQDPSNDCEVFDQIPDMGGRIARLVELVSDGVSITETALPWVGDLDETEFEDFGTTHRLRLRGVLDLIRDAPLPTFEWGAKFGAPLIHPQRPWENTAVATQGRFEEAQVVPMGRRYPRVFGFGGPTSTDILVRVGDTLYKAAWVNQSGQQSITITPRRAFRGLTKGLDESTLTGDAWKTLTVQEVIGSGDVPYSLGSDAIGIVMALLTSTPEGNNGPWDLGYNLGIAVPYTAFNETEIEALRERLAATTQVSRFYLGLGRFDSGTALEAVEALLSPFGLVWAHTSGGLTLMASEEVRYEDDVVQIHARDLRGRAATRALFSKAVDEVRYEFSPYTGTMDESVSVTANQGYARQRRPAARRALEVDASVVENPAVAWANAVSLSAELARTIPEVVLTVGLDYLGRLRCGGAVRVAGYDLLTQASVDPTVDPEFYSLGIVTGLTPNLKDQSIEVRVWVLDNGSSLRSPRIGASAKVASVATAGPDWDLVCEANYYKVGSSPFAVDAEAFQAGYTVRALTANGDNIVTGVVVSVTGNTIRVSGAGGWAAAEFIVLDEFASATVADQTANNIYITRDSRYT